MKICPMCGAQNEDVFTKCATCGADLAVTEMEPQTQEENAEQENSGFSIKKEEPVMDAQPMGAQAGYGQQPMDMQQPVYSAQPVIPPAPKAKKGPLIAILAAVVALVAGILIFVFNSPVGGGAGMKSPEDVCKQFVKGMTDADVKEISKLCPPFMDPQEEELQSMIDLYASFQPVFTFKELSKEDKLTGSDFDDLVEDISDECGKKIKIQEACDIEFVYNISMEFMGEKYDEDQTQEATLIKYKGKWYLYE